MSLQTTHKLIDDIVEKRKKYLTDKIQRYPANNFRASGITDCDRQMVYSILDWDKSTLYDEGLQAMFDRGNEEERIVVRDLAALGFTFIHQQNPIEIKNKKGEVICRGHIDGKILYEGEAIPAEIKSMNLISFNAIRNLESFQKKALHRKYLRQMQLYLYGNNEEAGIFILSDLQGHYKLIPVELDYGEAENILQRIERNWDLVKKKEYPNRLEYTEKICRWCSFKHLCLQEVKNEGAQLIDNEVLEQKLTKREELKPLVDEYKEIDGEIKETFKEIPQAFVGTDWQISGKWRDVTRVDTKLLPDDVKQKYSVTKKSWITNILRLDK